MISLTLVYLFLITLGVIWWLNRDKGSKKGKPIPGPTGIPILGNALQIGNEQHIKFAEWGEKYGDIFKVKLGSQLAYVISDPKMMKECFNDPVFSGRSFFEGFELYPNEPLGLVGSDGELWETHRRFLLRQLRDFGFGKSSMEQLIIDEVNETITHFEAIQKKHNCIKNAKQVFTNAVINALYAIVASTRFQHDDKKVIQLIDDGNEFLKELTDRAIYFLVPWTRIFLPSMKTFEELNNRQRQFFIDIIEERKRTYKEDNIRDFIDVYLTEMKAQKDNPESMFYGPRGERQLVAILADVHVAGSDTSSTTLSWALIYLSRNKNVQERLQKEISKVTADDSRQVSIADRPNLPYALAVIDEILRMSSIVPTGLAHRAMAEKEFKGYNVPKDTWIFPNLYYVHHNPKIWGDPQNFRPERFLSKDGLKYQRNENLMPFQVGRRQCLGETLARDSLFLFLTNLFQKFEISFDPNQPEPNMTPHPSFLLHPNPFSVVVKERKIKI